MLQAQAQAVAWQVASVGLVALALTQGARVWTSWMAAGLIGGAWCSSLFHWPAQGYPMLILLVLIGWATVWAFIQISPSAAWIEQSLVWLALINVGYAFSQWLGYDPLFESHRQTVGFFGRSNTLAALWVIVLPLAGVWQRMLLGGAILATQNWTALLGLSFLGVGWAWWRWSLWPFRVFCVASLLVAGMVGWWWLHPALWVAKALPRLLTWQETFGQALWSPVWGYGLGMRSVMSQVGGLGDIGYNIWLEAFHAGGLLILVPLGLVVRQVWRSSASPARSALMTLAFVGCAQSLWQSTGLVIVTLALVAAWELRRLNAV